MRAVDRESSNGSANFVPETPNVKPILAANYEWQLVTADSADQRRIQNRAYPLYYRYLHQDNIMAGLRLVDKIGSEAIVGFARVGQRDAGFTVYHLHRIQGLLIASIDATVVNRQYQEGRIAEEFAREIIIGDAARQAKVEDQSKLTVIDAMTARNSTPWPLLAKLNTGLIEKYYPNPVQKYLPSESRNPLVQINHREMLDDEGKLRYDQNTGLWTNAYPFEQGHRLVIDPEKHPEGAEIYNFWLNELKMDPENNDAVQVWLKVAKGRVRDYLRTRLAESTELPLSAA